MVIGYVILLFVLTLISCAGLYLLILLCVDGDEIYIKRRREKYLYLCDIATDEYIKTYKDKLTDHNMKSYAHEIIDHITEAVLSNIQSERGFNKRKMIIQYQIKNTINGLLKQKGYPLLYFGIAIEGYSSSYLN